MNEIAESDLAHLGMRTFTRLWVPRLRGSSPKMRKFAHFSSCPGKGPPFTEPETRGRVAGYLGPRRPPGSVALRSPGQFEADGSEELSTRSSDPSTGSPPIPVQSFSPVRRSGQPHRQVFRDGSARKQVVPVLSLIPRFPCFQRPLPPRKTPASRLLPTSSGCGSGRTPARWRR